LQDIRAAVVTSLPLFVRVDSVGKVLEFQGPFTSDDVSQQTPLGLGWLSWIADADRIRIEKEWQMLRRHKIPFDVAFQLRERRPGLGQARAIFVPEADQARERYWGVLVRVFSPHVLCSGRGSSADLLQLGVSGVRDAFWEWDLRTGDVDVTREWCSLFHYDPSEAPLTFDALRQLIHPDDLKLVEQRLDRYLRRESATYESWHRMRCGNDEYIWVYGRGGTIRTDEQGSPVRMIGVESNLSALLERTQDLRLKGGLLEHVRESVIATCLEGKFIYWGRGAERLYGWTAEEQLGEPASRILPDPETQDEEERARLATVLREGRWTGTYQRRRKDGSIFLAEGYISLVTGDRGEPIGFVGIDHDLTQRRQQEQKLRRTQTLLNDIGIANIRGEILSAIAHEIHQPLFAIKNFALAAKITLTRNGSLDDVFQLLDDIASQAERGSEIGQRLRSFARHATIERTPLSMHELLRQCEGIFNIYAQRDRVDLQLDLAARRDHLEGDALQLQHVVLNLVKNACEAIADAECQERSIDIRTFNEADEIIVAVDDSGPGVDPSVSGSLFEPFQSWKPRGMGIGLAVCRTIIGAHGGRIWHEPRPGGGASFCFAMRVIHEETDSTNETE
jgi:two-component system, LuxR family, sensor kinase FixL